MRILYFDCFSGIVGGMSVGALRGLGVPEWIFLDAIAGLHHPDMFHCHFQHSSRQGIAGWKFDVHAHEHTHAHEHKHSQVDEASPLVEGRGFICCTPGKSG